MSSHSKTSRVNESYLNAFACVDVEENTQSHQINQALIKPSGQILIPTIRAVTPFKAESFASVKKTDILILFIFNEL
ncbi:hypothetical protein [Neisseria sp. 74A18]|uniref:hypothetical protein n=1 Tax=Neisseria sp. 74A18 TaxID=1696094 RepID=UPI0006CAEF57|nr:hypothetical protein [Neisseria sp. 74A18]KPN73886.1 hypothetical protein AKG43_05825 [Neisseria sp. 74A18]